METLDTLSKGAKATVTDVKSEDPELQRKLLAMGLVRGTEVEICQVTPLGGPITVKARGYQLSLRLSEALCILVTPAAKK